MWSHWAGDTWCRVEEGSLLPDHGGTGLGTQRSLQRASRCRSGHSAVLAKGTKVSTWDGARASPEKVQALRSEGPRFDSQSPLGADRAGQRCHLLGPQHDCDGGSATSLSCFKDGKQFRVPRRVLGIR